MDKNRIRPSEIILRKFEEAHARNPRLSQRAFAQRIGLSSGAWSEVIRGKRRMSIELKKKIALKLTLSPIEEADFFSEDLPEHLHSKRQDYLQLSTDQFHLISDWWHYAILNLINTKGFRAQLAFFAERLGLSIPTVGEAWERLNRLGFVEKDAKGKIKRKHPRLNTTDGFFDLSIRKSHLEDLKLIENSIHETPVELRDITSMTVVINKSDLPKAREMIRLFQDKFSDAIESIPGEEVYRLNISFFPLTEVAEEQ